MKSLFVKKGPFYLSSFIKKRKNDIKNINYKQKVYNVSSIDDAKEGDLTFFDNINLLEKLPKSKASFCILKKKYLNYLNSNTLPVISEDPLLDFIIIAKKFYPDSINDNYIFKQNKKNNKYKSINTYIDSKTKIGKNFSIGANSLIKNNVIIGNNVSIGSNCVISNSIIGNNVVINHGTVIGKIGYGFKLINKSIEFIPHFGHVKIGDNVYIGSNCTIDRGSFSITKIGSYTMIDNLVHIAHNVKIGECCFIAGQVGVAGSTQIGNNCMIGGQAGISGHLKIGNNVQIGGGSGVLKNLEDNAKVVGYPAKSIKDFLKSYKSI